MRHPVASLVAFALSAILVFPQPAHARPPKGNGGYDDINPKYYPVHTYWSGTLLRQTTATTSWLLYPGACVDRALGTWAPKTSAVADSLQPTAGFAHSSGYTDNQPDIAGNNNTIAYTRNDGSLDSILWHVVNVGVPAAQRPAIINGSNSLWCGSFSPTSDRKVGYPNTTYQVLYVDTGAHASPYTLTFQGNVSAELNYDFLYILGGGAGGQPDHADPLGNRGDIMDEVIDAGTGGPYGDSDLLAAFTGSIQTSQSISMPGTTVVGAGSGDPNTVSYSITIDADHRALYFVVKSENEISSLDGLWPWGTGVVLDGVSTSDNGTVYTDETPTGGSDPYGGSIIKGTYGSAAFISARVPAGVGELWQLAPGNENVTSDPCSPQKAFATDLFFEGGDPNTNVAINKQFNSIVSCTFPIPSGAATVTALWTQYLDLPRYSGYVRYAEYRVYKDGGWSDWRNAAPSNVVKFGSVQAWEQDGYQLAEAAQADSVQLRWSLRCEVAFSADKQNCSTTLVNPLLYDDLRLEVTSGVPAPTFGIYLSSVAQTTFVDGRIGSTVSGAPANCGGNVNHCWPGIRGTGLGTGIGIDDNVNSPLGDSITVGCFTPLRHGGLGINWRFGFDKSVGGGLTIVHTNGSYNSFFDTPRIIYRLFDPSTHTWSAFDSSALDADAVMIADRDGAGGVPPDTALIQSQFRFDWPPRDKVAAAASLPGGFTINGVGAYSSLAFLPAGTRMQYYFKVVDINGGTAYQFSSDRSAAEVDNLPSLPGGSIRAPDIIEFDVLPGSYVAGPGGSLLAGKTDADVLNLDGAYTSWSAGYDPVTQALRGLGVRADRYRFLQGYDLGGNFGGHELSGQRIGRLSNFFPNYSEFPIADSLASWYRIVIQSSHIRSVSVIDEQDAVLANQWWDRDTGSNQGDRCIFASGDDVFNDMLNTTGVTATNQVALAHDVFGVGSASSAWAGAVSTPFPTIDDRFAAASAGPSLAAPSTFTYPLDGGCTGGPNRFDALSAVTAPGVSAAVFYPNSQVAGIARMSENDGVGDKDRSKALGYAFSIQFARDPAYGTANPNYARSGVENRMRVLYKFLTSCRGARTGASADTGKCWPCPSPGTTMALMQADWAGQSSGFVTGTWGPLYPIQAGALATPVDQDPAPPVFVNALLQNRPNPFNPETAIPYSLAIPGRVAIRVFDISGRCVRTLVDHLEPAGPHMIRWNGKSDVGQRVASGVYFYRITYPDGAASAKKLMIVR